MNARGLRRNGRAVFRGFGTAGFGELSLVHQNGAVKIPADTPFTFQTLDKNGMVLNMAQTWHQVRPGEVRNNCGGCHAHSQTPLAIEATAAGLPGYLVRDLTKKTPYLSKDETGETIVKEGEQAVAFFVVMKGRVEVLSGVGSKKQTVLNEIGAGQCFGEMALLDGMPRVATVRALEDTECLVLSRWDFVAEMRTNPDIAVGMLPVLSRRLREADDRLREAH